MRPATTGNPAGYARRTDAFGRPPPSSLGPSNNCVNRRDERTLDRRDFLFALTHTARLCSTIPNVWRVSNRTSFADDPFQLGVASGDPTPTGGGLWRGLGPRPLAPARGQRGGR